MKDWHVCYGETCARDDDFEDFNCADPIETADPDDELSLGPGLPGCELPDLCDTGMYPPCDEEEPEEYEGSAEVIIDWPELDPSDLIPQDPGANTPSAVVEVDEALLPYVDQYAFSFWYMFRFRSPARMYVEEKRAKVHGVAGITEGDTYCSKANLGDRALALFFDEWDLYDDPTYLSCSYDTQRDSSNVCKELDFAVTNVDRVWFFVYSGYSSELSQSYTAFMNYDGVYKAVTNPSLYHNNPPA